ncbi:MAG: asparagine synthase (glutamine-hydrolyzing) [Vicinamibacteria bacterium]
MCGIAGILSFSGAPIDEARLRRMAGAIAHRGPDAEGIWLDARGTPSVGLAQRRLSIIDLSHEADQPLANEDGSVVAVLNGEIYNFAELRRAQEGRHRFRSHGDTETIVHGYSDQGDRIVESLDGMFALALWDARRRRLLLARDPFGKKPLYYWSDGRELLFASEIKALFAGGAPAAFEASGLPEYLAFGYVPTPRTLYRDVFRVPPASTMAADAGGLAPARPYWDLQFPREGEARRVSLAEAAEGVRERLAAAVKKRLVADVPLGVLLSGGVDSAAVLAYATRAAGAPMRTFTLGFEGPSFYDERAAAAAMARHAGALHHEDVVRPQAASLLETLLHHHDEPFGDSSALPTYLVAKAAREHVTVVLNGDGGDETFAGYERVRAEQIAHRVPRPLRALLRAAVRALPRGRTSYGTLRRLHRFAEKSALPFLERTLAWHSFFEPQTLRDLGRDRAIDLEGVLASYRDVLSRVPHASHLSRLLYLNVRAYLLDDLLPKMDRMSMAHGLEARSPFLDKELTTYAASLPDAYKRRGAVGKVVLKEALRGLVPDDVLTRPKQGFGLPLGEWFRGELAPLVADTLLDRPRLAAHLRADTVRRLYDEHRSGRADRGHALWTLLVLELWLRKHGFE